MDNKNEMCAGFKLSGDFVEKLEDRKFVILQARNIEVNDLDNAGQKKKKCVLTIRIDGQELDWMINKRSLSYINKQTGYHLADVEGYEGTLIVRRQVVGNMGEIPVIYVDGCLAK